MKLFVAGVSHKTAPVEVREQLAVQRNELVDLARYLKWFRHLDEVVLVSTCNRVEIYGTTRQSIDRIKSALQLLSSEPVDLDPYIYVHKDAEAARHLFRVTAGVDSMVLGETEITGQIKNAYEIARNAGLTGPRFESAVSKGVSGNKRNSDAHRDRARHRFNQKHSSGIDWKDRSVAAIDHGTRRRRDGGELCSTSIKKRRAIDLAIRYGAKAVCFGDCLFGMRDVDVVIAATSSAETLLSCDDIENLMKARHNRPLLLIDLSVPRNIDPAVTGLDHVSIYNIDDLEAQARRGVQARERELTACHQIIEAHIAALTEKLHTEEAQSPWGSAPPQLSTTVLIPQPT